MPSAQMRDTDTRNLALDGVRGVGALIVLFWHLAVNFFPCAAWGIERPTSSRWECAIYESPLWVALSGSFAVCLFFVLSGYVLTVGYFRSRNAKPLIQRIVGRPIRLGVLPAVSTVAIWLGWWAAPHAGTDLLPALKTTGALDAVAPHLNLRPDLSFRALLQNIFWFPWFRPSEPRGLYNGVLWTMHVELLGSFLAMALALLLSKVTSVWLIVFTYMTIAAVLMLAIPDSGIYFSIFLCGSAIAAIDPPVIKTERWKRIAAIIIAICGLVLGGCNEPELSFGARPLGAVFSYGNVLVMGLGAVAFFYAILISYDLSKIFSNKSLVFFGRISFSLYVAHLLVIFSVGMSLFSLLGPTISVEARSIAAAIASLVISIGLAVILTIWIDAPTIRLARTFSMAVLRMRSGGGPP